MGQAQEQASAHEYRLDSVTSYSFYNNECSTSPVMSRYTRSPRMDFPFSSYLSPAAYYGNSGPGTVRVGEYLAPAND